MAADAILNIDGQVACNEALPLTLRVVDEWPDESSLERINASNEVLLRALVTMEVQPFDGHLDCEHGSEELRRLEARVGLLLHLVVGLVESQHSLPEASRVVYNARGLRLQAAVPLAEGTEVGVELYLNRLYPTPLRLFGIVDDCEPAADEWQMLLLFRSMSPTVFAELERMVFARHRRHVASQREG